MERKYLIIAIITIIIICAGVFVFSNSNSSSSASINIDTSALSDKNQLIVDSESLDENNCLYHTETNDLNCILVKNGGTLKLSNSLVNKTKDTASGDDADFYGVNSTVLVNTNGTLDISDVEIITNSKGSNGIFVTNSEVSTSNDNTNQTSQGSSSQEGQPPEIPSGDASHNSSERQAPEMQGGEGSQASQESVYGNTKATIKNVKITTHSDKSRGLDATYNGIINAVNVIINTDGQSCAALATDRGEGEVHVESSQINTGVSKQSSRGSPLIYSTGNITAKDTQGTAYVSQIACIEGKNSIELTNCDLTGYAEGNSQDGDEYVDLGGVFIYQSMSGDADVGTSLFSASNSKLSIAEDSSVAKTAPMFHITNTAGVINLDNTEFNFESGVFLEASGQNQWGSEESNGEICDLNTNNENINGNIIVDDISSLNWTMKRHYI